MYDSLPAFADFGQVADPAAFTPLPDDWVLMTTDIVRSRDAVAAGHYKTVNMIAASVVAALTNLDPKQSVPFVFGGDGASAALPPELVPSARAAMAELHVLAREVADLDLRIAAIPVADIRGLGEDLRVAKFELSPGNALAMFAGGGIAEAERLLKDPERSRPYRIAPGEAREGPHTRARLDGLSCRWEPVPAENGHIVTLLLQPMSDQANLAEIVADLDRLPGVELSASAPASAPVRRSRLRFRFPPSGLMREVRIVGWGGGKMKALALALFESLVFLLAVTTGRKVGPLKPDSYLDELVRNTDFRKFDDTLRLVLDLDAAQLTQLRDYLETAQSSGHLTYGLHVSESALMTCLVSNIGESRHIHFVDGSGGGYAKAAEDLEQRKR